MRPMLATRGTTVPRGPEWVHEVKWDGMRVLVRVRSGPPPDLRITSRNENDVTSAFPELHGLAETVAAGGVGETVLDGEVVAFEDGVPRFGALADRIHVRGRRAVTTAAQRPVTLFVFDLLRLYDEDVAGRPWEERRGLLTGMGLTGPRVQVPPVYEDGEELMQATAAQGLEGVVSKRRTAPYRAGVRSPDWLKFPHRARRSVVVGGWRPQTGTADRIGALLVGEPTAEGLSYLGRVGSGLDSRAVATLSTVLEPLRLPHSPFTEPVPEVDARGATWVEPWVVVDVESLGLTPHGRLRQPAYVTVRPDLVGMTDLAGGGDA